MMNDNKFINNLWLWSVGAEEDDSIYGTYDSKLSKKKIAQQSLSFDSLSKTEWSTKFERLMRNRMIMGAFRYGLLHAPGKQSYDRIASMRRRLQLYDETGNDELLVDIANMCLLEFEEGLHPNKHFASVDDGEHAQVKK
jgi:hypothetical protein